MADLIEIEAAFYQAQRVSKSDALRIAYENEEPDAVLDDDLDQEPDDETDDSEASSAEITQGQQARADNWFEHLRFRAARFGDLYPFEIEENVLVLRQDLTPRHALYLFLLVSSRLAIIERRGGHRNALASLFEVVSAAAARNLVPNMIVRIFGANSEDRRNHYGTAAIDAFRQLAEDLCESFTHQAEAELRRDTGERGIDIVGYYHWPDRSSGCFALFGQCAAQRDEWPRKALEAHPFRHKGIINFRHDPANVLFIPVCFRDSTGEWVSEVDPWATLLVDRVRLVSLLSDSVAGLLSANRTFAELLSATGLQAALQPSEAVAA